MSFRYSIELVAFTPITTTLFKTTLAIMERRGYPVQLHNRVGLPSLYLIDTDNEAKCNDWRSKNPLLPAPIVFIGKVNYDFQDVPLLTKPLKWEPLVEAIMSTVVKAPPRPTARWQLGYNEDAAPVENPLAKLKRPKALVVDDSATIRHYIGLKLASHNIDIEHAESGEQALEILKTQTFYCIFMDVMMAGMDGYQAARTITRDMKITTPIIMITSRDSPFDKMRGQISGSSDYLVKPIDDMSFNTTMQRVVRRQSN